MLVNFSYGFGVCVRFIALLLVAISFLFGFIGYLFYEEKEGLKMRSVICWLLSLACVGFYINIANHLAQERSEQTQSVFTYLVQTPQEKWLSQDGVFHVVSVGGKIYIRFDSDFVKSEPFEVEKLPDGGVVFRDVKTGEQKMAVSKDLDVVQF